ncbi:MAG: hypothetical protein A2W25_12135 [candidate division Zixibacteria bacterium RBG_16_53_22]|nr:MAG: hypothetical protein A2W25_12135 [candidate division Zixibacteria bacterium RBG_16_53_22]
MLKVLILDETDMMGNRPRPGTAQPMSEHDITVVVDGKSFRSISHRKLPGEGDWLPLDRLGRYLAEWADMRSVETP